MLGEEEEALSEEEEAVVQKLLDVNYHTISAAVSRKLDAVVDKVPLEAKIEVVLCPRAEGRVTVSTEGTSACLNCEFFVRREGQYVVCKYGGKKRKRVIAKRFYPYKCALCGVPLSKSGFWEHVGWHYDKEMAVAEERFKEQVLKNLWALNKAIDAVYRKRQIPIVHYRRLIFAVYRLYRYFNATPELIAEFSWMPVSKVRDLIGEAFKEQCIKDSECVFKKFFLRG